MTDSAADWFLSQTPLPADVMVFLNDVDKHNQKVRVLINER